MTPQQDRDDLVVRTERRRRLDRFRSGRDVEREQQQARQRPGTASRSGVSTGRRCTARFRQLVERELRIELTGRQPRWQDGRWQPRRNGGGTAGTGGRTLTLKRPESQEGEQRAQAEGDAGPHETRRGVEIDDDSVGRDRRRQAGEDPLRSKSLEDAGPDQPVDRRRRSAAASTTCRITSSDCSLVVTRPAPRTRRAIAMAPGSRVATTIGAGEARSPAGRAGRNNSSTCPPDSR